jgi:DNA-binding transcriptional LysR family regulator
MTEQGEILLSCCHQVFGQLDECLIELSQPKTESKQLVLSCEPTISMKWLIPRLSKFKKLGHDFEVVLLTAGGVVDFEKDNIDIAIRRNDFDWGEHIYSEKIADEYIAMVQATKPSETKDVLISTSRPNFFKNMSRIAELKQSLKGYVKVELEHFYLCLEACLAGLGATVISIYMIEKELEWNLLQKISPVVQDNSAYFLLSHGAFEEDSRKTIFLEWLKTEMNESQHTLL